MKISRDGFSDDKSEDLSVTGVVQLKISVYDVKQKFL